MYVTLAATEDGSVPYRELEWVKVSILLTVQRIICRTSNRVSVGAPYSRMSSQVPSPMSITGSWIFQYHLWFRPRSHPDRPLWLFYLAIARYVRYKMSDEDEGLDEYTLHLTEAILHLRARLYIDIVKASFLLTESLIHRSHGLEEPGYVTHLVKYLRASPQPPLEAFNLSRKPLTEMLIWALSEDISSWTSLMRPGI
jgi:hypothetical protein